MRNFLRIATVFVAVASLAGCGIVFPNARDRAARNTPGFKAGYSDGCASANAQGTNYRNDQVRDPAYAHDRNYQLGWASGLANCRTNSTHAPNAGPIPDNNPGTQPY
jgi:predicted small lipoprotein YifL